MDATQLLLVLVSLPAALVATIVPKYLQTRLAYWLVNRGAGGEPDYPWEEAKGNDKRRMSLNPLVQFELLGTALAALVRVGWGAELRLRPEKFERPVLHTTLIALTGPALNLAMGFIFSLLLIPVLGAAGTAPDGELWYQFGLFVQAEPLYQWLFLIVFAAAFVNIRIGIFNLIPLPPLDNWQIARALLPESVRESLGMLSRYAPYGFAVFLLLVELLNWKWFEMIISTPASWVFGLTGYDGWEVIGLFGVLLKLGL